MGSGRSRCRRTWLASGHDRSARAWRIRLVERRRLSVGQLRRRYPGSAAQPAWAAGAGGRLLGWVCRDAAGGELSPGIASAVVLVDIVPNMDLAGASRIHAFMAERVESGFGSLDEVADVIANYNPHRPRPSDPDGLVANLRRRGDRWYWHWDPQFIGGIAAFPPVEVTDVDRMNAAVATILRDEVPVLRARPSQRHRPPRKRRPISLAVSASRVHRCARRRTYGRRRSQRRFRRGGPRFSRSACRRPMMGLGKVLHSQPASACVRTPTSALACRPYVSLIWVPSRRAAARR